MYQIQLQNIPNFIFKESTSRELENYKNIIVQTRYHLLIYISIGVSPSLVYENNSPCTFAKVVIYDGKFDQYDTN